MRAHDAAAGAGGPAVSSATVAAGNPAPHPATADNRLPFAVVATGLLLLLGSLGLRSTGQWSGVLVTERKVMSLSRLQVALWTCVLLSGITVVAFAQIKAGDASLDLSIPPELLALMGISTASAVAAPLVLANKEQNNRPVFRQASGATFADVLEGDEVGNADSVDLGKVQMLTFTLVVVATYLAALLQALAETELGGGLPKLSTGMIALLGLSHAGYLTFKATDHQAKGAPVEAGGKS